jgi:hypothetical protein
MFAVIATTWGGGQAAGWMNVIRFPERQASTKVYILL